MHLVTERAAAGAAVPQLLESVGEVFRDHAPGGVGGALRGGFNQEQRGCDSAVQAPTKEPVVPCAVRVAAAGMAAGGHVHGHVACGVQWHSYSAF